MKLIQPSNLFLFSCLLLLPYSSHAQKKVLGMPQNFQEPIDFFENEEQLERYLTTSGEIRSSGNAWMVFSDRDNNSVFEEPTEGSRKINEINLGDFFYVIEEKENWIKIVEARVDRLKIISLEHIVGWIKKENMLLWTTYLSDASTGLPKKAFLLNTDGKVDPVIGNNQNNEWIYRSPLNKVEFQDESKPFTDYYFNPLFIVKKDAKTGMYLLSEDADLNPYNIRSRLIGWVSKQKVLNWNTRICLEPNFDDEAFKERKNNPTFHAKAFKSFQQAKKYASGEGTQKEVFWENDPVLLRAVDLAMSNSRRFKGNFFRFPVLNSYEGNVFRTIVPTRAVFDSIESNNLEAVDIFFVLENSPEVIQLKENILLTLESIKSNFPNRQIRFGVLIYNQLQYSYDSSQDTQIQFLPLTSNVNDLSIFFENFKFQKQTKREYSALCYALYSLLNQTNIDKEHRNLIYVLGSQPDIRTAKSVFYNSNYPDSLLFMDLTPIHQLLAKFKINLHIMRIKG